MEKYEQKLVCENEEKVLEFCRNLVKAVEKTREVAVKSKMMCQKANDALVLKDKPIMWNVLQECIILLIRIRLISNILLDIKAIACVNLV